MGRVFLVVSSSFSSLQIYCAIPFWFVEILLRNQLINLCKFPCMLFVIFPLVFFKYFTFVFNFCQFDYYMSWCVHPWVYPVWDSLCFLDLAEYFFSYAREVYSYYFLECFLSSVLSLFLLFVVELLSQVWLFATPQTAAHQASMSFSISWSLFKLMSIELMMPSNHLTFCLPLLLLPSIFLSITIFSNESALSIRLPKYWRFSFRISHSNEGLTFISRLFSFSLFLSLRRYYLYIWGYWYFSLQSWF